MVTQQRAPHCNCFSNYAEKSKATLLCVILVFIRHDLGFRVFLRSRVYLALSLLITFSLLSLKIRIFSKLLIFSMVETIVMIITLFSVFITTFRLKPASSGNFLYWKHDFEKRSRTNVNLEWSARKYKFGRASNFGKCNFGELLR